MLEWIDAFDQYGPSASRLLDGVYAQMEGVAISTTNPRTGTRHLRINAKANDAGVRRVLSEPRSAFGLGYAFSIDSLPVDSSSFALLQGRNADNNIVFTVNVGTFGNLIIRNGGRSGAVLASYDRPCIFSNSYQHFEVLFDGTNGFKLWINEVLIIDSIAVPSGITGGNLIASVKVGNGGFPLTGAPDVWDVDDLFCYNTTGSFNNSQIGDCKVYERFPNEDLSPQEFDISVGTDAFEMLNNVPAQDGTEYLSADGLSLPKRAAFGMESLPLEITEVRGVMVSTRAFKTDAGAAKFNAGVISNSAEEVGADHAMSMAPIWFGDVFDVDPDTSAAWTLSAVNDLTVFIERIE